MQNDSICARTTCAYSTHSFISRYMKSVPISRSGLVSRKSGVTNHVQILQDHEKRAFMFHCPSKSVLVHVSLSSSTDCYMSFQAEMGRVLQLHKNRELEAIYTWAMMAINEAAQS